MSPVVGRCGPISWGEDRVGVPQPGACGVIWRELMRLGYLRLVLRNCPSMPTAHLAALLACAPEAIVSDSASRGHDRPRRDTHHVTLRWLRRPG